MSNANKLRKTRVNIRVQNERNITNTTPEETLEKYFQRLHYKAGPDLTLTRGHMRPMARITTSASKTKTKYNLHNAGRNLSNSFKSFHYKASFNLRARSFGINPE